MVGSSVEQFANAFVEDIKSVPSLASSVQVCLFTRFCSFLCAFLYSGCVVFFFLVSLLDRSSFFFSCSLFFVFGFLTCSERYAAQKAIHARDVYGRVVIDGFVFILRLSAHQSSNGFNEFAATTTAAFPPVPAAH
jgi:hypothetical protein